MQFLSNDLSGITGDYLEKSVDEAVNSDLPMIFITFPSAKDPTFNERYPGNSLFSKHFFNSGIF